ncbi:microtubule-associated protein 70-5-like [Olea europaea var. sylvestris]|uniref:microtubule-associated protein 70-5-like n=1 Tax=Olea europaea var. sylvestris TaxID=158386 RepID=UPI000C1D129E|nr:microtubule-associated protein 70-5-like [Olea europaea var. sylvestris]XP_022880321.1 microtubule-associated protein 70-5-like [Olea europaea var. sylvestris]
MHGLEEIGGGGVSLSRPDPVVLELNRLQNQLKERDQELGKAQSEIKALTATEILKDKALDELGSELKRFEEKLRVTENLLEQKNLETTKLANEKRQALTAQYAAEATLRRVYANQKDDDSIPIESIIAPLEAELKTYKNEVAVLQENKRALERLTKSKEAALLEAERILKSALERALVVEEVQNQNFELRRQIEICQEENKILDKTNRQKVLEVEKLSQTIQELEEAILAGGAAANTLRDYKRQISELNEEKRTLERELARIKVSANRVATVVANEWKDENDKVMPVKQWLEERRMLQAEMQRLRDKLAISERTAKAETQLKNKLNLRLKTLEEGLKHVSSFSVNPNANVGSPKTEKSNHFFGILASNTKMRKRSASQPRGSTMNRSSSMPRDEKQTSTAKLEMKPVDGTKRRDPFGESLQKKSLWASRNKFIDSEKENAEMNKNTTVNLEKLNSSEIGDLENSKCIVGSNGETKNVDSTNSNSKDVVSGFLYDRLQKEVINLRKYCEFRESSLNAKDEEIKMLAKKVETLLRAMQIESKKTKREAAIRETDLVSAKGNDKIRKTNSSKRS